MWGVCQAVLRKVPVLNPLGYATPEGIKESSRELSFIWFFTSIPLLVNTFIDLLSPEGPGGLHQLTWALGKNLKPADVFIYVNAFVAPVMFSIYKHHRDQHPLRSHIGFIITIHTIVVLSAVLLGLNRGGTILDFSGTARAALILYCTAVLLRFLSIVTENFKTFGEIRRQAEGELTKELDGYTGGKQ